MCDDNNLDRLIDAALSTYADPGPASGLEARLRSRLMTQIEAERETGTRRWRWLWAGGALAAAVCTVLLIAPWRSSHPHAAPPTTARIERPDAVVSARKNVSPPGKPASVLRRNASLPTAAHSAPPKLEVFPMPAPLTGEERALAELAAQNSGVQIQNLLPVEQPADAPIDIAAIAIPPIKPPSAGKE
jgi:hypothetical protein